MSITSTFNIQKVDISFLVNKGPLITYSATQFKLDRKLCVAIPSYAMYVISFAIISASTHKTIGSLLEDTFRVSTQVKIVAPCECINEYNKSRPIHAIVIVDCVTSNLPHVTKH